MLWKPNCGKQEVKKLILLAKRSLVLTAVSGHLSTNSINSLLTEVCDLKINLERIISPTLRLKVNNNWIIVKPREAQKGRKLFPTQRWAK